jgi:hypothetical protein
LSLSPSSPIPALQAAQQNTFGKKDIALSLQCGNETPTLTVPLGTLGIAARPELPPAALKLYELNFCVFR